MCYMTPIIQVDSCDCHVENDDKELILPFKIYANATVVLNGIYS